MIANPSKHQGMILHVGKTDHQFNFSVNDPVELFGITIDKDLTFKQHVSSICKKVNNQFSVMTRFGTLIRVLNKFWSRQLKINTKVGGGRSECHRQEPIGGSKFQNLEGQCGVVPFK